MSGYLWGHYNASLIEHETSVTIGSYLSGSSDVGGADFDFVKDGCLYEVKTTIKPVISVDMLRQCVGYWLLDYDDAFAIRDLAIDLPRQGVTHRFDVRRDLLRPEFKRLATPDIRCQLRDLLRQDT